MSTSILVRDMDPDDKFCPRSEARQIGMPPKELVRHLIHEKRTKTNSRSRST
ncbi:MAG: hypothetical protein OXF73_05165 [Gammaproteobacteria bacterium]|nr:hypothetical protein [Gammaproteobacteria bacterium]